MKTQVIIAFLILSSIVIFSCSSDTSTNTVISNLLGTWYKSEDTYITFFKNGTMSYSILYMNYYGNYSYEENEGKGFISLNDSYDTHYKFELSGDILTLHDLFGPSVFKRKL